MQESCTFRLSGARSGWQLPHGLSPQLPLLTGGQPTQGAVQVVGTQPTEAGPRVGYLMVLLVVSRGPFPPGSSGSPSDVTSPVEAAVWGPKARYTLALAIHLRMPDVPLRSDERENASQCVCKCWNRGQM